MTDLTLKRFLLGSTLLLSLSAAPAWAQTTTDGTGVPEVAEDVADGIAEQTITDEEAEEFIEEVVDGDSDEIVVTGSRLRQDTFTSITPLQVIDTDFAAQQGLFNPVEILQSNSSAAGQQIDSTFGGFVLDNGPGSETVNLRGLGASRSLVLIDGRRLGPSGVEGAPSQPSINAIPNTFVDRYDILLDGASSVYGSDAVAGVVNAILKKDFDGLEIDASVELPEQSGGEEYTIGASYGINADRGFIGVQGEYFFRDNVLIGERDFFAGCDTIAEQTETGEIRTTSIADQFIASELGLTDIPDECRGLGFTQSLQLPGFGFTFYQPGVANTGVGAFSDFAIAGVPLDQNADGIVDTNFEEFTRNDNQQDTRSIINQQERVAFRAVGEYTLEGSANVTPYFDIMYTELKVDGRGNQAQFFPFVPANNPFNPCNLDQPNGQDCNAAYNDVITDPQFVNLFQQYYNNAVLSGTGNCFGRGFSAACTPAAFGLLRAEGVSERVRPVVGIRNDRSITDVDIEQQRYLLGVRGELPGLSFGEFGDVSWDFNVLHSYADSDSRRPGIREDRLALALGVNPFVNGEFVGLAGPALPGGPCAAPSRTPADLAAGCVPVNLFAPSLYTSAVDGDFATQAERDYVFDTRDFATVYEQTTVEGTVQASLFSLPGGDVRALAGFQWRQDDLDSTPDNIAAQGLFFGFFSDLGASGDRTQKELFGEINIPLGLGTPGFREFDLNLSGRLTDDEFYGTNETYAIKAGWRPIDALLVRGTYGTSFRAPTVRELFLQGQTGFNTLFDPCAAPDSLGGTAQDPRNDNVLAQCRADGVDPLTFSPGQPFFSTEISSGGTQAGEVNTTLDPEESTSFTAGVSFDQPFTDAFDLELGFTYYEYDIENTFDELTAGQIIASCYDDEPGIDPACAFITRDFSDPQDPGRFDVIFEQFINEDQETAKGIDLSADFGMQDVILFGQTVDFFGNTRINRQHERRFVDIQVQDDGTELIDDEEAVGEFGFAKWRGFITGGANIDKFGFAWTSRYIGGVEVDEEDLDVPGFSNIIDSDFDIVSTLGTTAGDANARRISFADDYWVHTASLSYAYDEDLSVLVGVSNVFDTDPPIVDGREVFSISNVSTGNGYDLNGRSFFARLQTRF